MPMQRVTITRQLRRLIRLTRKDRARLTQREASDRAGLSEVWWRQIENGHTEYATADTLAAMCDVLDIAPDQLRRLGEDHLAELVEERHELLEPEGAADAMEAHIMTTPGLTESQRKTLAAMARALRDSM